MPGSRLQDFCVKHHHVMRIFHRRANLCMAPGKPIQVHLFHAHATGIFSNSHLNQKGIKSQEGIF
jgi:hypothetical protein